MPLLHYHHKGLGGDPSHEEAVQQIRHLRPEQLDHLAATWLSRIGVSDAQRLGPAGRVATYRAVSRHLPVSLTLQLRIHQRQSRLQAHHVDAFAGYLVRHGSPVGILITTGDFSPEAMQAARSHRTVSLRLFSGRAWTAELSHRNGFLYRQLLWRWLLNGTGDGAAGSWGER